MKEIDSLEDDVIPLGTQCDTRVLLSICYSRLLAPFQWWTINTVRASGVAPPAFLTLEHHFVHKPIHNLCRSIHKTGDRMQNMSHKPRITNYFSFHPPPNHLQKLNAKAPHSPCRVIQLLTLIPLFVLFLKS